MMNVLALPVLCIRGLKYLASLTQVKQYKCFDSVLIAITPIFLNLVKHS